MSGYPIYSRSFFFHTRLSYKRAWLRETVLNFLSGGGTNRKSHRVTYAILCNMHEGVPSCCGAYVYVISGTAKEAAREPTISGTTQTSLPRYYGPQNNPNKQLHIPPLNLCSPWTTLILYDSGEDAFSHLLE